MSGKSRDSMGKPQLLKLANQLDEQISQLNEKIRLLKNRKKYGLVWEEHKEEAVERCADELPVLSEEKKRAVSGSTDGPVNLLIEGDNYHALSVLNYTHQGEVDVIYIDPPYNTGNQDFRYGDKYVDKTDGFRHSKWISMMHRRLALAANLLSEKGTIFISIDDNEMANLKLLCDDVFGRDRFITAVPRITSPHRPGQETHMAVSHDYILVYSHSRDFSRIISKELDGENILKDKKGRRYVKGDTSAILAPRGQGYSKGGDYDYTYKGTVYKPVDKYGRRNRWLWTKDRMDQAAKLGILVPTGRLLRRQNYLDFRFDESTNSLVECDNTKMKFHTADFMKSNKYSNTSATKGFKKLNLSDTDFNNPKPVSLIRDLIDMASDKSSIVLDFFAGSGTTGHAVLRLNNDDGGKRSFILCTNNENGIASKVCYPRIKKIMEDAVPGYDKVLFEKKVRNLTELEEFNGAEAVKAAKKVKDDNKERFDSVETKYEDGVLSVVGKHKSDKKGKGLGGSLRYFKTDFAKAGISSRKVFDSDKKRITEKAVDMLCVCEGTYEEVKTQPSSKKIRFFRHGDKFTGILHDRRELGKFKDVIKGMDGKVTAYVFTLDEPPHKINYFADMGDKVEQKPIPEEIIRAYRRIFRIRR